MASNSLALNVTSACAERKAFCHLAADLVCLVAGPMLILTARLIKSVAEAGGKLDAGRRIESSSPARLVTTLAVQQQQQLNRAGYCCSSCWRSLPMCAIRGWAADLLCAQGRFGLGLMLVSFCFSMLSLAIYATQAALLNGQVEYCASLSQRPLLSIDLALNCFFGAHFCLRFLAAQDKLLYWLEPQSIIDYFTVPTTILGACLGQYWLGLRFIRGLRILVLPDLLLHLGLSRSGYSTRLLQLLTIFISVWLIGAGMFHILENTGDVHRKFENSHSIGFGDSLYLTIVTMSTVGYGDISAKTDSGKMFACLYILLALSVFASHIPEMAQMLTSFSPYAGSYRKELGRPHLVACGAICHHSMKSFLADLLHKDRKRVARNIEVVCIGQFKPDIQFQGLLKRHFRDLVYFEGTVMSPTDCIRVALNAAEAAVVLANKYAADPDEEDASNIMRVIAIKNAAPRLRCIVQLLRQRNQAGLVSIPSWDWRLGDECVCTAELKLGLLAQSCLAPGFSTLLANLLAVRSMPKQKKQSTGGSPQGSWESDYKRGCSFEIYSQRFGPAFHGMTFASAVSACYAHSGVILLAVEEEILPGEAETCRRLVLNPSLDAGFAIRPGSRGLFLADSQDEVKRAAELEVAKPLRFLHPTVMEKTAQPLAVAEVVEEEETFDSAGAYHWCSHRQFEDAFLVSGRKPVGGRCHFSGHHILCIIAAPDSPIIGLSSFLRPLRSSSLRRSELAPVVLLGDPAFLRREWHALSHFPDVFIVQASSLCRAALLRAGVHTCDTCVLISAKSQWRQNLDPYLMDREVVLCTLNIKAMDKRAAAVTKAGQLAPQTPVITEIFVDKNILFLDQEDDDKKAGKMYTSQPFACGAAFAASALDSLLSTVYYNPNAMTLIRTLVAGGADAAEALEFSCHDGDDSDDDFPLPSGPGPADRWHRARVTRLLMTDSRLASYALGAEATFGRMFLGLVQSHGILCLGLARFRDAYSAYKRPSRSCNRIVIACPAASFPLMPTDAVYCVVPFPIALSA